MRGLRVQVTRINYNKGDMLCGCLCGIEGKDINTCKLIVTNFGSIKVIKFE